MSNPNTHIYLYAKDWYETSDTISDLKIILGERSGINPQYITEQDIIIVLCNIVYPLLTNEYLFSRFVFRCNKDGIINALLSEITFTKVDGLNLGKADSTLLPLRNK